ncbi:hypothetical protein ILUMI_01231 [Ignelater luminosus]|uniref:RNA helicase n=1 Tax=Ignelater luminosus TaxID=2038154 RepID=A0A8K0GHN2_IGNLU|nr:hypothetical protein ILUMI_01231 [Ignelater luminosus]
MSLIAFCHICVKPLFRQIKPIKTSALLTDLATKKLQKGALVISCKREEYNHYSNQRYNKFDEVILASKGWNHSKAKGDYFTVHPNPEAYEESPRTALDELELDINLKECLQAQNIHELTAFQTEAISVISQAKHAMLTAETGCGKTLAYLLPILQSLIKGRAEQMNTPRALIVIPSRELAYQVGTMTESLAKSIGLKLKIIVGGRTKQFMLNPEFKEVDLLIGTPGVIGKLSNVGIFRLNDVLFTVLDEADTLLDDSFIDRLTGIIKRVPQSQLTLVSATSPNKIPAILEPYEQNLVYISSPLLHKPLSNITQQFLRLLRSAKPPQILQIVKHAKDPLLIFTNRSKTCDWLSIFFGENGVKCSRLNGDMNYAVRIEEWNNFIQGKTKVLVATDAGSRGLNTTQIKHVVNYDFPLYAADYIHRIGRTGRFGSPESCKVTNFISGPEEVRLVQKIEASLLFI